MLVSKLSLILYSLKVVIFINVFGRKLTACSSHFPSVNGELLLFSTLSRSSSVIDIYVIVFSYGQIWKGFRSYKGDATQET